MASSSAEVESPNRPLVWGTRAVLLADVVESVRLTEQDELDFVSRWLTLIAHTRRYLEAVPDCRFIKDLGDGMLLEFAEPRSAVAAAFVLLNECETINVGVGEERRILLRMGLEVGPMIMEGDDLRGRTVNLAARLMGLAAPGEIVISANAREQLTAHLDAEIEDLGDCYLRHLPDPVRAFRVGPPGYQPPRVPSPISLDELAPLVAVVPFRCRRGSAEDMPIGQIIAEEAIRDLSTSREVNVVSRLSTSAFFHRDLRVGDVRDLLGAAYVLSGSFERDGEQLSVDAELMDVASGHVLLTRRLRGVASGLVAEGGGLTGELVQEVRGSILRREAQRAQSQPIPSLRAYSLLLSAITLMYRLGRADFERAEEMLRALLERGARHAIVHAWLANWYVLRVQQGWSADPRADSYHALAATQRALDLDPDCPLALTIDGVVHTTLLKGFETARDRFDRALELNPNEPFAWLQSGTLYAFRDDGAAAVDHTRRAVQLSPLDPHRHFFDSLSASACVTAHRYEEALEFAKRSFRANRAHTSTLRSMIAAQVALGRVEDARTTARELLRLDPTFTVGRWRDRAPSAGTPICEEIASAMRVAGLPD